jgi:hypothetical protein
MATEAPVRASAAPATRRPAAVVSASRLLLGQRPFLAPSASRSRFAAGRAAVAAGVGPRLLKPRISVVAMAGNGERVPAVWRSYFFFIFSWPRRSVAPAKEWACQRTGVVCGNDQDTVFVELR